MVGPPVALGGLGHGRRGFGGDPDRCGVAPQCRLARPAAGARGGRARSGTRATPGPVRTVSTCRRRGRRLTQQSVRLVRKLSRPIIARRPVVLHSMVNAIAAKANKVSDAILTRAGEDSGPR